MKNLSEILANERAYCIISNLAKSLGFKNNTIKLYFEKAKAIDALNLVVDVDYASGGNANNAHLLEAKLINAFKIDVVVIVAGKVADHANKLAIANSSFSLDSNEFEISQFLDCSLEAIIFRDPQIDDYDLKEDLKSADRTIAIIAKRAAGLGASVTTFGSQPQYPSSSNSAEIDEFLSPEHKNVAKEILESLPDSILLNVLNKFNVKKNQQDNENNRNRSSGPSVSNTSTSRISVK